MYSQCNMECQNNSEDIRPTQYPCRFCNQFTFFSQPSLCDHEVRDHGYVRPATVTTAKIAPSSRLSCPVGRPSGTISPDSFHLAGPTEPHWVKWTKDNEQVLKEVVFNFRTSHPFQSGESEPESPVVLDFVPDYSAADFPQSLFTKSKDNNRPSNNQFTTADYKDWRNGEVPVSTVSFDNIEYEEIVIHPGSSSTEMGNLDSEEEGPDYCNNEHEQVVEEDDEDSVYSRSQQELILPAVYYVEDEESSPLCINENVLEPVVVFEEPVEENNYENPMDTNVLDLSVPSTVLSSEVTENFEHEIALFSGAAGSETLDEYPVIAAVVELPVEEGQLTTDILVDDTVTPAATELQLQINTVDSLSDHMVAVSEELALEELSIQSSEIFPSPESSSVETEMVKAGSNVSVRRTSVSLGSANAPKTQKSSSEILLRTSPRHQRTSQKSQKIPKINSLNLVPKSGNPPRKANKTSSTPTEKKSCRPNLRSGDRATRSQSLKSRHPISSLSKQGQKAPAKTLRRQKTTTRSRQ